MTGRIRSRGRTFRNVRCRERPVDATPRSTQYSRTVTLDRVVRIALAAALSSALLAASASAATISGKLPADPVISPASTGPATPVAHSLEGDAASTWTAADFRRAAPPEGPAPPAGGGDRLRLPAPTAGISATEIVDPSAAPHRIHGKIFFRIGQNQYGCSGTVVDSRKRNVIFTAGHCVFDTESGTWVEDLVFVPGYRQGERPLGTYNGGEMVTPKGWVEQGDSRYDVAAVALDRPIQNQLGARKIHFGADPTNRSYRIFGYPARPAELYDGERLIRCDASFRGLDAAFAAPQPIGAAPCDMMQGSSGGGWITDGNYLASVISYGYCDDVPDLCGITFGPQLLTGAISIYNHAAIGGSGKRTIRVLRAPPRKVRKRSVVFRFAANGSTPMSFRVKLDRQGWVDTSARITIRKLTLGRHVVRIRSEDQTGRRSAKLIKRVFRVLPKKRPQRRR